MRYLIDTNILIPAVLFPANIPALAFQKAISPPNHSVICDYSLDEMQRVFNQNFAHRMQDFERFVSIIALSVEIVSMPALEAVSDSDKMPRDISDKPIFRAAVASDVDGILTEDKDFLDLDISRPKPISAAEFLMFFLFLSSFQRHY